MKQTHWHGVSSLSPAAARLNYARCSLSLESGEAFFSLLLRYCRLTSTRLESLVNCTAIRKPAAFRDLIIGVTDYEQATGMRITDRPSLRWQHSAGLYYLAVLLAEDRRRALAQIDAGLQLHPMPDGSTCGTHLRYCAECAAEEYRQFRFSFWHRDHQLPLTVVCLQHDTKLLDVGLSAIRSGFPHEMVWSMTCSTPSTPSEWERMLARLERSLAIGGSATDICHGLGNAGAELVDAVDDGGLLLARLMKNVRRRAPLDAAPWLLPLLENDRILAASCRWLVGHYPGGADPSLAVWIAAAVQERNSFAVH